MTKATVRGSPVPAGALCAAALVSLGIAGALAFQVPPQGDRQAPTFRSRTDLVQLDISVLDKDRRPVRGLTAADFTVLEDGKPQSVSITTPRQAGLLQGICSRNELRRSHGGTEFGGVADIY